MWDSLGCVREGKNSGGVPIKLLTYLVTYLLCENRLEAEVPETSTPRVDGGTAPHGMRAMRILRHSWKEKAREPSLTSS